MKLLLSSAILLVACPTGVECLLSDKGCQCIDACTDSFCDVDTTVCDDAKKKDEGRDSCSTTKQAAVDIFSQVKDMFNDATTKMEGWTKDTIATIDIADVIESGTDKLASFAGSWENLSKTQWSNIKALSAEKWGQTLGQIPTDQLLLMSQTKLREAGLDGSRLAALKAKIAGLSLADSADWAKIQWDRVPIENIASSSVELLKKVPVQAIGNWTQEQWNKIPVDKVVQMSGNQIAKIDTASVSSLGKEYWDKAPVYQVTHFAVELMQSAKLLEDMNATHVAYLTSEQWKSVPVGSVSKFTLDKIQAIDYGALSSWSKEAWDKMPFQKLAEFSGKQIQAIPASKVGTWTKEKWAEFDAAGAVMFTGEQLQAGAAALSELADEQLSKFDWKAMTEEAKAKVPAALKARIANWKNDAATTHKALALKLADTKAAMVDKFATWQAKVDDENTSDAETSTAKAEYETFAIMSEKLQQSAAISADQINTAEDDESSPDQINTAEDDESSAARAAPALLAVVLAVAVSM